MFVILAGIMSMAGSSEAEEIEEHTILALELNKKILDNEPSDPFADMSFMNMNVEKVIGLNDLLENIKKAKTDDNIDGIFLKLSSINAGISTVEEIRNALIDFKNRESLLSVTQMHIRKKHIIWQALRMKYT
ncbi:MAG: hypothetical protein HC831_22610 [Chloroflexia bacterium]|nr:hypothetical protein [Chloroflexia bacterium]